MSVLISRSVWSDLASGAKSSLMSVTLFYCQKAVSQGRLLLYHTELASFKTCTCKLGATNQCEQLVNIPVDMLYFL
jgi:hypothetical protein